MEKITDEDKKIQRENKGISIIEAQAIRLEKESDVQSQTENQRDSETPEK